VLSKCSKAVRKLKDCLGNYECDALSVHTCDMYLSVSLQCWCIIVTCQTLDGTESDVTVGQLPQQHRPQKN
jgi:hypothetical protein